MINGRELFAEISNEAISEDGEAVGYFIKNSRMELLELLLSAQPAPAVPEAIITAPIEAMRCGPAASYVLGWNACRAAMLAQPVSSGYKLPDNVREALTLALQAMEFMGDTLNNIDAVCTEDVEYVTPAFNAVRELLAAAPEGGN